MALTDPTIPIPDSDVAASFAQELAKYFKPEDIVETQRKYLDKGWPEEYINRDTGRTYKPHNLLEVRALLTDNVRHLLVAGGESGGKTVFGIIKDLERLRRGMSGLMVCVAGDTLIDGIPIAERTTAAPVNTTLGLALALPALREGRADLFRVATQSGGQVVVTKSHRFLTPVGWRQLQDLDVGDLVAFDDSACGRNWREIPPGFLDGYWSDSRLCDGCANGVVQHNQGKSPLPVSQDPLLFLGRDYQVCACIVHSTSLLNSDVHVGAFWPSFGECEPYLSRCGTSRIIQDRAFHSDSLLEWPRDPILRFVDSDVGMQNDHVSSLRQLQENLNIQVSCQSLLTQVPGHTIPVSCYGQTFVDFLFSYPHYTTYCDVTQFSPITSITFQEHGDFYGLTVPFVGNYSAQGLFHHNSPDFEHFRKSIWPEFRRWCPWDRVVENHQYRQSASWEPQHAFTIVFNSDVGIQSTLMCGGCIETDLKSWEGPNVNFAHMDEMRRHKTPIALKTLLGRVRIPGPNGEPPQLYMTTTPSKHWLFDYFGPLGCTCTNCRTDYFWKLVFGTVPTCPNCGSTLYITEDPWHEFKLQGAVVRLRTEDNEENTYSGFARDRALSLSSAEARVLLDAEWEDLSEAETFLPSLTLWDLCQSKDIPPLDPRDPIILAVDAAKGRITSYSDCFAIVGVSRHWEKDKRRDTCVVRFVLTWQAKPGEQIDFSGDPNDPNNSTPNAIIRKLCKQFNIIQIAFDPTELHDFGMRLRRDYVAWLEEFSQMKTREEADSDLLQLIIQRRIVHDGNQTLRQHIGNADRKVSDDGHKFRIVKRLDHLKVDAAVALSMACYRCLHLNIA